MDFQRHHCIGKAALLPFTQLLTPDEVTFVQMHKPVQPAFQGRIFNRQFGADHAVGFLDPHSIHGADTERLQLEFSTRIHQRVKNVILIFDRMVQFPAKLADIIHPERHCRRQIDINQLAGKPWEGGIRKIGACDLLQDIAGTRTGKHQHPD